eukprot:2300214-Prymnesium_polylepis.1
MDHILSQQRCRLLTQASVVRPDAGATSGQNKSPPALACSSLNASLHSLRSLSLSERAEELRRVREGLYLGTAARSCSNSNVACAAAAAAQAASAGAQLGRATSEQSLLQPPSGAGWRRRRRSSSSDAAAYMIARTEAAALPTEGCLVGSLSQPTQLALGQLRRAATQEGAVAVARGCSAPLRLPTLALAAACGELPGTSTRLGGPVGGETESNSCCGSATWLARPGVESLLLPSLATHSSMVVYPGHHYRPRDEAEWDHLTPRFQAGSTRCRWAAACALAVKSEDPEKSERTAVRDTHTAARPSPHTRCPMSPRPVPRPRALSPPEPEECRVR